MASCVLLAGLLLFAVGVVAADEKIYVHVVPHTHDDVGWLKTVDEYFYGANNSIQHAAVQYILDTVIEELQKNPNRTFIYVEIAFFSRWWNEQSDETKDIVRKLVTETHQLEFINAGWCMNDEASTDYNAIIDQMSLGLRFVEENFGPTARPRVGWHIDPFGHSAEMATLQALFGMDGFFFARIDYDDRNNRLNEKTMEMVWRGSRSLGEPAEIFTGVLYYGYGPPPGLCFDIFCNDQPIQDDPNLFDYNVDERVKDFVAAAQQQAAHYATNHIMFTMGSDFEYEDAREWYKNLDKLMYYVNSMDDPNLEGYNVGQRAFDFLFFIRQQAQFYATNHVMLTMGDDFNYENAREWFKSLDKLIHYTNELFSDQVEVFYSTPSRYLDALNKMNRTWTVKTDDFFPYADHPYAYWTGYFTSRPALKGYSRMSNSLLQSCKQLEAIGQDPNIHRTTNATSVRLQQAVGVDQHHDAISGTEKQHVADDYAKRLHIGQVECQELINDVLMAYMTSQNNIPSPSFQFCEYVNISVCPASETGSFNVMAYNPIGRSAVHLIVLPVQTNSDYQVLDQTGNPVTAQLFPVSNATKSVRRNRGNAPYVLSWGVYLPPMGGNMYFVRPAKSGRGTTVVTEEEQPKEGADFSIDNGVMTLTFNGTSGRLMSIDNKISKISAKVDQNFLWWNASAGNNVNSSQASGAYVFRPNGTAPFEINPGSIVKTTVINGPIIQEVRQEWSPWLYQSISLYKDAPVAVFMYTVGPIPFQDNLGKEIISRFSTDLKTDATWYTDANGRQMQKRVRNFRPTWKYNNTEPVSGNYYPVDSRIYIRDESQKVQFTVLTDRAQGGSSLNDGQVELMVHRRLLYDDDRGVGEPLNETGQFGDGLIIRGLQLVVLDNYVNSTVYQRLIGEGLMTNAQYAITPTNTTYSDWVAKYTTTYVGIAKGLPPNVHLLTLEKVNSTHLLLRLDHMAEIDEAPLNTTASVELENLFTSMKVTGVLELGLGANAPLSDIHRLQWNTDTGEGARRPLKSVQPPFAVELKPMEIRTFLIAVEYM